MSDAPPQPTLTDALTGNVPGIHWPVVVGVRDAAVLALLFQMESTQWLSAEALREQQNRQLVVLLDHARRHCAFYRQRLPNDLAMASHNLCFFADVKAVGVATGTAFLLFSHALRHVAAATGGTLSLAEPVTAFGLAIMVVGERPDALAFGDLALARQALESAAQAMTRHSCLYTLPTKR